MEGKKVIQNKTAVQNFSAFYQCEDTADMYFVFPKLKKERKSDDKMVPETRIPAHKIILAANSSVFHRMFYGEMKETGDIAIIDATPYVFGVFLQYFYLEQMNLTIDKVGEVLYLADKYDVSGCSTKCSAFLKEILNTDNMCWGYELAI